MPSAEFETAADEVTKLKTSPSNEEKLEIYALFKVRQSTFAWVYQILNHNFWILKQTTVGDCNTSRPGMLDFTGKAKWDAWNAKKGMATGDAEAAYIKNVAELKTKYN